MTEGVYLPERTGPVFEGDRLSGFDGPMVKRSVSAGLEDPARSTVITRDTAFGDMFLLEIARGCPFLLLLLRGARDLLAVQVRGLEVLSPILEEAARHRSKVGLVSTSLNTHPQAASIFEEAARLCLRISPPSLRSGMISQNLTEALSRSGVRGVALAPETGSEQLRAACGKRVANETILEDVRALVASGIKDIKLYFMVGLPGEEKADIDETVDLVKRIRQTFIQVSRGNRRMARWG
jgi:radical SAM superfamily enzyme YgiQ (UPF0313 family)